MIRPSLSLASLAVLLAFTAAGHAATYTYSDTTFVNADWTGTKYVDTTPGAAANFFAAQNTPGGSPILPGPNTPDYRLIRHVFDSGAIIVSHQDTTFNWSPLPLETAQSVDYTYDLKYFDGPTGAVGFKPAIFQGGNVYVPATSDDIFGPAPQGGPFPFGWQRFFNTNIPLSAFAKLDPTTGALFAGSNPSGVLAMGFGFTSANSANSGPFTKISGLDNYGLTLNTKVAPEPATLLTVAAATTLFSRRRRSV
jgi:hypothetical protein